MEIEIQFQPTYYVYVITNSLKNILAVETAVSLKEGLQKLEESKDPDECKYMVYFEQYEEAIDTIRRESKLSGYSQRKLKKLVETKNPGMKFLNEECNIK